MTDRFASGDLVVIAGDTVGCQLDTVRAGFSQVNVGQRPYQMGHDAPDILIDIIEGKEVDNPMYTGPRRMHDGERRQLRQRLVRIPEANHRKGPSGPFFVGECPPSGEGDRTGKQPVRRFWRCSP